MWGGAAVHAPFPATSAHEGAMVGGGPPFVPSYPIEGIMRGRGRFWLASCHRRWDIRPSSRKDSSELRKDSSKLKERQQ